MPQTVILLVDDEKTVLDSLAGQLRRLYPGQFEVEAAQSAEEALEVLEQLHDENTQVVVVVSDWLMPGMRGDEFLTLVRTLWPGIGRILLTGQADPAALDRARTTAAVHRILFKPWRPDELGSAIVGASEARR